jgi:hypothetical protein
MKDSGSGWAAELLVVFFAGFLLASLLAAGAWFVAVRPGYAAALRRKEDALRQKEAALLHCTQAKDQSKGLIEKLEVENGELDKKLKAALAGWGRCIKGGTTAALKTGEAQGPATSDQ